MNNKRLYIFTLPVLLGLVFTLTLLLFLSGPARSTYAAGPWYVAPGGNDDDDCESPSTPCETINGAIGKASSGDTIYVATGEYVGTGPSAVVKIDEDLTLEGGWDSGFTTQSGTSTIDGGSTRSGVVLDNGKNATIDHFTVQNSDGGVSNFGVLLTVTHSILQNNNASGGPGGGFFGGYGTSTTIIDSQIYGNETAQDGGGIYLDNSDLTLIRSWVVGNAASTDGGGIQIDGGSATIENSIIAGNFTNGDGGGIRGGPSYIINSHIIGNVSLGGAGAIDGRDNLVVVTNTLIISNTGESGIAVREGSVIYLDHCDTYGNSPDGGDGTVDRTNCLGDQEWGLDPMMAGGTLPAGTGPAYAEQWLNYDYHLLVGSPAIDTGTPTGAPATDIDGYPRDANPDMGAYEYWEPIYIYMPVVMR